MKLHALLLAVVLLACALPAARAEDEEVLRLYDVGVLLAGEVAPPSEVLGLPPGVASPEVLVEDDEEDEENAVAAFIDPDTLEEIVESALARAGSEMRVGLEGRHLAVRTSAAGHELVERTLAALWRDASLRITVEGHWVRLDAGGRQALHQAGLMDALEQGRLDGKALELVLAEASASGRTSSATTVVRPGWHGTLGRTASRSYVQNYGVEIAMDSIVGDPIVRALTYGWFADVRPFLLQDGSVLLEVVGQTARVEGPIRQQALEVKPFGSIELPVCSVLRFAGTARVRPGRTVAWVSAPDGDGGGLELFLLRPEVRPTREASGRVRRYDVSALVEELLLWGLDRQPGFAHDQGGMTPPRLVPMDTSDPLVDQEELVDAVVLRFEEEIWERGGTSMTQVARGLIVEGDDALHVGVRDLLRTREGALRTGRVGVRLLAGDGDAARELAAAWLDVPYGRSVGWQAGVERAYVADWDVEVAQEARMGDPIVANVFGGLALSLMLQPAPVANLASLHLDLARTTVDPDVEIRRLENECTGIVEVPRLEAVQAQQDLVLEVGAAQTIDAGRLSDGRSLRIEVTLSR